MRSKLHAASLLLAALLVSASARAERLALKPFATLDVSAANIQSFGDIAVERFANNLWISEGTTGGRILRVSTTTGALLSSFPASVVPGLALGPRALAIENAITPRLYLFSAFGENEGGRVTPAGVLVTDFDAGLSAMGADFDFLGRLWLAAFTAPNSGAQLRRVDPNTGAVQQFLTIPGSTSRAVDVAFDPITLGCFVLFEDGRIGEVDLETGALQSTSEIVGLVPQLGGGGFDFDRTGEFLYVALGDTAAASTSVAVLRRDFDRPGCTAPLAQCPCANPGSPGGGCENSFGTGGAALDTSGVPRVALDTFRFEATRLPPVTSCLLFQGTAQPSGGPQSFGDGVRCVAGTVVRLGVVASSNGVASWPAPGDPGLALRGGIPVNGGSRNYQVWYRNAAAFCTASTFNLSNSLDVEWFP